MIPATTIPATTSVEALARALPRTPLAVLPTPLVAAELRAQLDRDDVTVLVPTGSGGTLAGLVAGNVLLGRPWTLLGGSASRPPRPRSARC